MLPRPRMPSPHSEGPTPTLQVCHGYHLRALHRPSRCTTGFTSEGRRRGSGSPGPRTCHVLMQGASRGSRGLQSCPPHISHEWSTERKRRQSSNHSPTPSLLSWSKPFLLTHLAPLLWLISVLQRVSFIGGRDTASLTMGWGSVTPSFSPSC